FEFFFALLERGEIDSERFLRAQRFARTIGFDRPIIDAAAKLVELKAKFAEYINKLRPRESLEFATGFDAELFQFSLALLADSPDLAHGQVFHETRDFFRLHLELAVWLVNFACDFRDKLVWTNPGGRCEFRRAKNCAPDFLRERCRRGRVRADIEISFVERKRFDDRSKLVKNSADDRGFAPVNIEPRREHDQV